MKKPYILIITGHSCTGKSTLIKELRALLPKSYHIGYDSIKWGLAGYDRRVDKDTIRNLLTGFREVIFKCGISCITDDFFQEERNYKTLRENAEKYKYTILSIELKCPEDIRLERFRERVKRAKADPNSKISVTDESVFLENMKRPIYFPKDALVFDTSIQDVQEISKEVLRHLHDRIKACE